jgi:hypothetical protein
VLPTAARSTRPRITRASFHPTATAGTYGAAAAEAAGLSKEQIISAFGVSAAGPQARCNFWSTALEQALSRVGAAAMNG